MNQLNPSTPPLVDRRVSSNSAWGALRLFTFYRIILAGFFIVLSLGTTLPSPLDAHYESLYSFSVYSYFIAAIILLILVENQLIGFRSQVFLQTSIDFIFIGTLMYVSGGASSGLGLLIVMSVAAGSLLLIGKTAFFLAAVGSLVILLVEVLIFLADQHESSFMTAGLLGAVLFATVSLAHILANRVKESEALAAQRGQELANLSLMNARIVQRMRSGLMVLSHEGIVQMTNDSATELLGVNEKIKGLALIDVVPELHYLKLLWLDGNQSTNLFRPENGITDIQVSFTFLGSEEDSDILIFLEDAADLRQQAQQLKLASLGQLTASIAHEIRNPLGAISHAGQLLSESPKLEEDDQRLMRIVLDHSSRVNQIIENVLKLGRRDSSIPESFFIKPWLKGFIEDFRTQHNLSEQELLLSVEPENIRVTIDQSQLYQIITNLCENALRYSTADPKISIICAEQANTQRAYLDVIDQGPGIDEEKVEQIFEPFFTDRSGGTGLGLYIARELCEANQAFLALNRNTETGCGFRINFAHSDKQFHID